MKAVVQRVKNASIKVGDVVTGKIKKGILVYIGFSKDDTVKDVLWALNKIPNLRIFNDEYDKMNLSVLQLNYDILVVSQFTLLGNCKKGFRPSFDKAAKPNYAKELYNLFVNELTKLEINIQTGIFQSNMDVFYINDGPVTIILDSKE